ncbi:alpha-N-acetylglucosaminidase TIM-barrel domain-containing protein [Bifidobacterium jacchi]|uniref:alpha-N-acetylglucosaminidase TIM-barrel domain-containing protein n=1 Tax=Bifidobacterium jacchi TaxID=2490545 RepID=UPI001F4F5A78|nr:alpha-N-acetylglucosaminidase TIM-barrel domain-containing protein [Bifidobacterium jacchi]
MTATGASADGHAAALAVDGDRSTYWQSPGDSSMSDYRRFLDFDLHGTWNVSQIDIANVAGSAYHYEVYLSADGADYSKVAYKNDDRKAGETADAHAIDATRASYARIAVGYNSAAQQVNLAEVTFHGTKISDDQPKPGRIAVTDFASSSWGKEYERVATDADYARQKTITETRNLVKRVIGEQWVDRFDFVLRGKADGKSVFTIEDAGAGRIRISGDNGVSLASGLNYYLRHWCKVDYNPLFGSQLNMPKTLPAVGKTVLKYTNYEYRYALNFCTFSYTMAFWKWDDYERFLDWAAMNGVNLMLDIVGQEEVLRETLTQYGYTDDEVREYLSGPAYYAWFYMQNLYSVGGPLPAKWFEQRVELGRRIHDRMQAFGITPVIQGFGGQVPTDFQTKNPKSVAASSGTWSGFDRPYMIKTYLTAADKAAGKEDYFAKVGDSFYAAQKRVFGDVSHYYAVDPFHEGGTVPEGFNIVDIYRTVQQRMLDNDKDAVWVMQQWQWGIDENKLSGLANKNQALVLDLQSDLRSQASPMENQGVPWVWNMLHNFGGRMGMDGVPEVISQDITKAYESSSYMRGIGITPEAIDNSPIVYELLFDMTWEQDPIDWRAWTRDYAERRYGGTDKTIEQAWQILLDTAYKHKDGEYYQGASESIINARPSDGRIGSASTWGHSDIDYDKAEFEKAAALFAKAYDTYKDSPGFRYDYVDVMRQVLANSFQEVQPLAGQAYRSGDAATFKTLSKRMLDIITTQEKLLASDEHFLLGTWIESARTMLDGEDDWTADLFELNARSLVTTWGLAKNGSLIDYSNRQWAGLTGGYYQPRWATWAANRINKLDNGTDFTDPDWFAYGWQWANRKSDETGDGYAVKASDTDLKKLGETIVTDYTVAESTAAGGESEQRTNLALGRDVIDATGGDGSGGSGDGGASLPGAKLPNMTDGDTATGWTETGRTDATLEIDLGGDYAISGAGITLQQIAADFPLRYEIEVWNGSAWVEVGRSTADKVSSKNEIDCDVTGSKVRFKLHSTDGKALVGIYELAVWGAAPPQVEYTNLALGAAASAKTTEPSRSVTYGIDGDESTLWVGNGSDPNWYRVDLGSGAAADAAADAAGADAAAADATAAGAQRVDKVRLVFEQAGRLFQFKVVAGLKDGTEKTLIDQTGNQSGLDRVYEATLGAEVTYVTVEFTGSVGGTAWPAIAELELLQETSDALQGTNIASAATITSSPTKDAPEDKSALVDGTANAWVSRDGAKPAWFQLDYDKARNVDSIRLRFEEGQPDRSMQFTLTVTDADGTAHKVYERTAADLTKPQGITLDIPVGLEVKTIRMDITDARIPSYGGDAWPLVREIEVYATPQNVARGAKVTAGADASVAAGDLAKLVDGDRASSATLADAASRTVTLSLDKPADVNTLGVLATAAADAKALRFKAEYRVVPADSDADSAGSGSADTGSADTGSAESDKWTTLADYSGNTQLRPEIIARLAKPAYTDKVRFTFLGDDAVTINELYLYRAEVGTTLESRITAVQQALDALTFGDHAGEYRTSAKTKLVGVLDQARTALSAGVTSREVAQWLDTIDAAVSEFHRTGYVSVDRGTLNVSLDQAAAMITSLNDQQLGDIADALSTARDSAKSVAVRYKATQAEIDAADKALTDAIDAATAGLTAEQRYQTVLAAATALHDGTTAGEFAGQHPESALDTLAAAIAAARDARKAAGGNAAKIDAASDALNAAIEAFKNDVIIIDDAALRSAIDRAAAFSESAYDAGAWKAMTDALTSARAAADKVDAKQISQTSVNAAADDLNKAIDALGEAGNRLDRTALADAIGTAQQLKEGDYTAESWKPFAKALDAAIAARDKVSTTQKALNAAAADLVKAREGLKRKGSESVDPDKPSEDKPTAAERDALRKAILDAQSLNKADYTETTWKPFHEALVKAIATLDDADATRAQTTEATRALNEAREGLKKASDDGGNSGNGGNGGNSGNGSNGGNSGGNNGGNGGNSGNGGNGNNGGNNTGNGNNGGNGSGNNSGNGNQNGANGGDSDNDANGNNGSGSGDGNVNDGTNGKKPSQLSSTGASASLIALAAALLTAAGCSAIAVRRNRNRNRH